MAKVVKSSVFSKYKGRITKAILEHKDDEVKLGGGGELPPGVNGIAQLREVKFGQYGPETKLKGEYYLYMAGIVKEPAEFRGLRTNKTEPMCDTPESMGRKTIEEHTTWAMNEFKKLGYDTSEFSGDPDELVAAGEALKEAMPHFRFRTWVFIEKGKKDQAPGARTLHEWGKACEYVDDETSEVVDSTAEVADETPAEEETSSDPAPWEGDDLDEMATAADEGNEEAATKISEQAEANGLDPEKYDTWTKCVTAIKEKQGPVEEKEDTDTVDYLALGAAADDESEPSQDDAIAALDDAAKRSKLDSDDYPSWGKLAEALHELHNSGDEETEFTVKVKEVVQWTPKKGAKKVEVEIVKVNNISKTASVKRLDDHKVFSNVAFAALSEA